ncbi:MAG: hypothetical protein QOE87_4002, partial [Gaiellales bacterium]|nr:hypothetical protein [Gaiellales bacterium]
MRPDCESGTCTGNTLSGDIGGTSCTDLTPMRAVALLAVGLSVFLLAGSVALGAGNKRDQQRRTDQRLSATAGDEAARLEAYFE